MNSKSAQLAHRMHTLRVVWDWSADRLAEAVAQYGVPWTRSVVANIENNRRDAMTVDELFAVAGAFGIPPMTFFVDAAFLGAISTTLEGQELMRDPEFVESLGQMARGETVPARTAIEAARAAAADEEGDVPESE